MAMPRRVDVDDYFAKLAPAQRPHLELLRELSRTADVRIREALRWNQPSYEIDGTNLWLLQAFKAHASLRFPPRMFAAHAAEVEAAGYEAGEGFIKLPFAREIPVGLCRSLIIARVAEYDATGAKWSD